MEIEIKLALDRIAIALEGIEEKLLAQDEQLERIADFLDNLCDTLGETNEKLEVLDKGNISVVTRGLNE